MRKEVIGLVVLFSISIFPAYSAAPPKAGATCSKVGLTQTYLGKKFTCIKSGKKLVWDKGIEIQKVTPLLPPTPMPSSTPTSDKTSKSRFELNLISINSSNPFNAKIPTTINDTLQISTSLEIETLIGKIQTLDGKDILSANVVSESKLKNESIWKMSYVVNTTIPSGKYMKVVSARAIDGQVLIFYDSPLELILNASVSPYPGQDPSGNSSSRTTDREKVSLRKEIVYRLNNGVLERQSDQGDFYSKDSRSESDFDSIRVKAYKEIMSQTSTAGHPNVQFVWEIRPGFPLELRNYCLTKIAEAAALFNVLFKEKIIVKSLMATELDIEYPPLGSEYFSETKEVMKMYLNYDPAIRSAGINGGGGGLGRQDNELYARLFLGTASKATPQNMFTGWTQVPTHEFFHIVQQYLLLDKWEEWKPDFNRQIPSHFREGSANLFGYAISSGNLGWYSDAIDVSLYHNWNLQGHKDWQPTKTESDIVNLLQLSERREDPKAFATSYVLGSLFYEWVIGTYGLPKFLLFVEELGKNSDFNISVEKSFGLSKSDLYKKSAPYLLSVFNRVIN